MADDESYKVVQYMPVCLAMDPVPGEKSAVDDFRHVNFARDGLC